ncbi:Translin [Acaromyces ingoldii]|uniref:Translin n=1 Tax=Acaromyces ingoldii TaxID=215250 RepID=A0A316YWZ6_9BASI|nr:Translin [Acaromyces ingoldii]PWN93188.1 Translin [Acaromyces ingoldii]
MASGVQVDFSALLAELEADRALSEKIREQAKELDKTYRSLASVLNRVHSTPANQVRTNIVDQTVPPFEQARHDLRLLVELVPDNQFWKWNDAWSMTLQRASYAVALTFYLGTGRLITKDQTARILALDAASPAATHGRLLFTTEEYLHSLVSMINDLSRLAVNSVTLGDFATPLRLSAFVKDLHAGFQLLNLKNDSLRKRFDSIKYDVKKIEEVVYDISLRGLVKPQESNEMSGLGLEADEAQTIAVLDLLAGTRAA